MTCDPNALQWITALGAVVVAVFAVGSAAAANRSARAAERHVEGQLRPLLIDVPHGDYLQKEVEVVLPNGEAHLAAVRGELYIPHDGSYVSTPIRNVGAGVARIESVGVRACGHGPFEGDRPVISKENVPPGEETRVGINVSGDRKAHAHVREAVRLSSGLEVVVTYNDLSGEQRQRAVLALGARGSDEKWRVLGLSSESV